MPSVIVCLRFDSSASATDLGPADLLVRKAQQIGGAVCAFLPGKAGEVSLAFDASEVEAAVALAASAVAAPALAGPRDRRLRFLRAGITQGSIETFLRGDAVRLSWGSCLGLARMLAEHAPQGRILVSAELLAGHNGRVHVEGEPLELNNDGKVQRCFRLAGSTPLPATEEPSTPPDDAQEPAVQRAGSYQLLELAREALGKAEEVPLDHIVASLKLNVDNAEVIERLAGVLAMTRGAKEEGLRLLRRGAETEKRPEQRARAILAYAIGVAAAGRHEDSLLEALTALAAARALNDKGGEKACARFLSRLSSAAGHPEAASAWEHVALRALPE